MPSNMTASIKVLIVEEKDLLREKIAGILSREKSITMVMQVSTYSKLQSVLKGADPDIILGDFYEFNKFCKEKKVTPGELCPDSNILLYTDEYRQLNRIEVGQMGVQNIFNVRRIQQEVRTFLKDSKLRKHSKTVHAIT